MINKKLNNIILYCNLITLFKVRAKINRIRKFQWFFIRIE